MRRPNPAMALAEIMSSNEVLDMLQTLGMRPLPRDSNEIIVEPRGAAPSADGLLISDRE